MSTISFVPLSQRFVFLRAICSPEHWALVLRVPPSPPYKTIQFYGFPYETKFFIILFERGFKMMKNGVYFIVIALLVAELLKILTYAN